MKALLLSAFLFFVFHVNAQKKYVGPSQNVGREYGNPKMPLMVSHLAGANKERLKRANKNSRHSIFGKVLCFRKLCRIQSGHSASLKAISFKKLKKKTKRNAEKGYYKDIKIDTTNQRKPIKKEVTPIVIDTAIVKSAPATNPDSLIILGAELLFETNKSTLRVEHFTMLDAIVQYLILNPERAVKISGHTDTTGSEEHNLTLSKRRADAVAQYMVGKGVGISRIETFGLGSSNPMASNTTDEGRKKNRRVELLIHD